ncbi:hypothetical protein [Streptomyces sp. NPDC017529]|uniref:hypothetical protein n=1 Tax=Streptomyces sp. NPDC017529 TaxID=3365000 RepID=UPI003787BA1F
MLTTDGLDAFQFWRDGACVENFEPGMEHTRTEQTTPWWGRVKAALAAHDGEDAGVAPVVALVLDHLGITYAGEGPVPPGTILDFGA